MNTRFLHTLTLALYCSLGLSVSNFVLADQNDSQKPMAFRSQSAQMDDLRKTYIYRGQVRMTQGSRLLTANQVEIKQDAAGFSQSTATGTAQQQAYVKQRQNDGKGWMEGWGERIVYDDRTDKITFFDHAHIKTTTDDAQGDVIIYDNVTERYQILAKGQPIPEQGKSLPAQPGASPHKPAERQYNTTPSSVPLPSRGLSTAPDGRAKAVITPQN